MNTNPQIFFIFIFRQLTSGLPSAHTIVGLVDGLQRLLVMHICRNAFLESYGILARCLVIERKPTVLSGYCSALKYPRTHHLD